jgi:hypothetical protein
MGTGPPPQTATAPPQTGTGLPLDPLGQQLFQARLKANDFVQEHLKTIVTIASGTLVLTVSFVKDIVGPRGPAEHLSWLLAVSWGALGVAVFCGIFGLAVLVNNLDDADLEVDPDSGVPLAFAAGKKGIVLRWEFFSLSTFALGILALALFGALNYRLFLQRPPEPEKPTDVLQNKQASQRYTLVSTPEPRSGPRTSHTFLLDQSSGQMWQMVCVKGHLVGFRKVMVEGQPAAASH